MRKIVLDFDLTIVLPLFLLSVITLWNSIRAYRQFPPERKEKWNAQKVIWISCGTLISLCILLFIPDAWEAAAAYPCWLILWFVSAAAVLVTIAAAWRYARKADWFRVGICVIVMLMIVAGMEHFFHQSINARHAAYPESSGRESDDN